MLSSDHLIQNGIRTKRNFHQIEIIMVWYSVAITLFSFWIKTLQWRHNGRDSVSNHQPAIVYFNVYSDADQRKHQSSASLAFVRGIHRGSVNSPHKWPVTRKMFPFDDVIMAKRHFPRIEIMMGCSLMAWTLDLLSWCLQGNTQFHPVDEFACMAFHLIKHTVSSWD